MGNAKRQLSTKDFAHWYDLLEKRKNVIQASEDTLKRHVLKNLSSEETGELSKTPFHSSDLVADAQEMEMLEALSEKNNKKLNEINAAIKRLENGAFGLCENCNDPILLERLEAIPETRYCLDCEQDIEGSEVRLRPKNKLAATRALSRGVKPLGEYVVSEVMQENPITVSVDESLEAAASLLSENNIRHLPVVDEDGDIQGVLSDRDLLSVVLRIRPWKIQEKFETSWDDKKVGSIMTKTPETVSPDTTLQDAGSILLEFKISCLPVVDGNRLIGILTESDFVRFVSEGGQQEAS